MFLVSRVSLGRCLQGREGEEMRGVVKREGFFKNHFFSTNFAGK